MSCKCIEIHVLRSQNLCINTFDLNFGSFGIYPLIDELHVANNVILIECPFFICQVCCGSSNVTPTPRPIDVTPTSNPGGNGNGQLLPSNCGQTSNLNKIFGGEATGVGEFPWMAVLGYKGIYVLALDRHAT